jgi:hypothetical protein
MASLWARQAPNGAYRSLFESFVSESPSITTSLKFSSKRTSTRLVVGLRPSNLVHAAVLEVPLADLLESSCHRG